MPPVEEVSFELERFEWTADNRLEVVGRWNGVRGRRISRPALTIESGGRRRRLAGTQEGDGDAWRASFTWDGGDISGAELELGRSLVVELPPPRRRRRRSGDGDLRAQVDELRTLVVDLQREREAEVARLTGELEAVRAAEPESAGDELAGLRLAHGSLKAAHEQLEDELEALRDERDKLAAELERLGAAGGDAEREKAQLGDLIRSLQEQATSFEAASERLTAELAVARGEVARLQLLVGERDEALALARQDAERRIESERATVTEVHARLATAREEAQRTMVAEAEETERLRAELARTRDESERLLAAERAEVARLREELLTSEPLEDADREESARRMLEEVMRDLESERAVSRGLRRELDEVRRGPSRGNSNGTLAMGDAPAPETVAGRVVRTPEGTRRRVDVARAAASARVPRVPPSPVALWTVRIGAVIALGVVLVLLASLLL